MIFNYYEENLSIEEMTKILNTEVDVIFTYCNYTNSILEFYAYRKDKLIIDVRNKYDDGVSDKKIPHDPTLKVVYGSIFSFKGMLGLPININTKEIFKKADKVENRRNYAKFKKIVDSFIDPKIKINKIRMREIEKEIISKYNSSVYLINDTYPSQIDYENAINSVNLVLDKYPKFKTGFEILPYTKVQIDENNKDAIYILKYDKLKLLWVLDLKDDEIYSKYEKYIYSIKNELIGKFKNTNLLLDIQDDYVRKIDVYLLKK